MIARTEIVPDGTAANATLATVIYLQNLSAPRVGREADETIIESFLDQGMAVITLDYADHAKARVPFFNRDLFNIRDQILADSSQSDPSQHQFPTPHALDHAHIFIVPEGCRLLRDVEYDTEGRAMDIIYPSDPAMPVGGIIEYSADNVNRMGNFSLAFCHDTILPAQASEGFAVAMADHPVVGGYSGLDPMPQSALAVLASIQTFRAQAENLPLNGRIATMGFSRGSGVALMGVTTADETEWDVYLSATSKLTFSYEQITKSKHPDVDRHVQGAVIMSGRFTYIDLLESDGKAAPGGLYTQNWGPIETNLERWKDQGAIDYLEGDPGIPLFLTINKDDEHAWHQMDVLRERLTDLGVEFEYYEDDVEPLAHRMPLEHNILNAMNSYFRRTLMEPTPETVVSQAKLSPALLGEGKVQWTADVQVPLADYPVEISTNLQDWSEDARVRPDQDGNLSFETVGTGDAAVFVRLASPRAPIE